MTEPKRSVDALSDTGPLASLMTLMLILAFLLATVNSAIYLINGNPTGAAIGLISIVSGILFVIARIFALQGRRQATIALFTLTLSLAAIITVWVEPESLPITVLIPPLILITTLQHLDRRELGPLIIIACLVSLALVISGEFAQPVFRSSEPLAPAIRVIAMVGVTIMLAITLWNFSSRLHTTLTRLEHTNAALGESESRYRAIVEELFRSEQQFKAIAENAPDIITRFDRDFRYLYVNPAFVPVTGLTRNDALGKNLRDLGVPDAIAALWDERFHLAIATKHVQTVECELEIAETTRFYESRIVPELSPDGEVESFLAISRDATERREKDFILQHQQKRESLSVMAGGIAHEFNNLLGIILGNAEIAQMNMSADPANRSLVEAIAGAGRRAAALMRQMVAYIGQNRLNISALDVNTLIEEMKDLLQASIPRTVTISYQLDPLTPRIEGDMAQLRQVLLNLTINAAEAIGDSPGDITITTSAQHLDNQFFAATFLSPDLPAGMYVVLQVSDTGRGMDANTLRRVFDPFFTTKFVGRGLGLPATLGIVRSHYGAIKIDSIVNKGTTVTIVLPAIPRIAAPSITPDEPATGSAAPSHAHGIVLVVEDEEGVRAVATRMLEAMGYPVLATGDASDAIRLVKQHHEKLVCILLDMTIPHQNTQQTIGALRAIRQAVPIVLMSGYTEDIAMRRFSDLGLNGFLQKPFTSHELRDIISRSLMSLA